MLKTWAYPFTDVLLSSSFQSTDSNSGAATTSPSQRWMANLLLPWVSRLWCLLWSLSQKHLLGEVNIQAHFGRCVYTLWIAFVIWRKMHFFLCAESNQLRNMIAGFVWVCETFQKGFFKKMNERSTIKRITGVNIILNLHTMLDQNHLFLLD